MWEAPALGLYRLQQDDLTRVIAVGPAAPKEFVATIAGGEDLAPLVEGARGGIARLEQGMRDLRQVSADRPAAGRGWLGLTPRSAYVTTEVEERPLLPAWAWLALAVALSLAAWLTEGRTSARRPGQGPQSA